MAALHLHYQIMQIQEIAMITGEQNAPGAGGMCQMDCVILARKPHVRWNLYIMPRLLEKASEK